jgi:hypothetical protein
VWRGSSTRTLLSATRMPLPPKDNKREQICRQTRTQPQFQENLANRLQSLYLSHYQSNFAFPKWCAIQGSNCEPLPVDKDHLGRGKPLLFPCLGFRSRPKHFSVSGVLRGSDGSWRAVSVHSLSSRSLWCKISHATGCGQPRAWRVHDVPPGYSSVRNSFFVLPLAGIRGYRPTPTAHTYG